MAIVTEEFGNLVFDDRVNEGNASHQGIFPLKRLLNVDIPILKGAPD